MLVERQYPSEYAYSQQETYLRNNRIIELQRAMEELKPFPMQKNEEYNNGVLAQGLQQTQRECYTIASSLSSKLTVHSNRSYFSGGTALRGMMQSESVCRSFTKMNNEVTAFGPKHAEHARRFYQSEAKEPERRQAMIPSYRQKYIPTEVSYYRESGVNNGSCLLGDPVFNRDNTTWYTKPAMVKVARISPRPNRMRPKTSSSVGVGTVNKKQYDGLKRKSVDDSRCEMDLKNAPVFQILCEISKT